MSQSTDSTRVILKYFGSEVARLRERRSMSQPQLAKESCYSVDLIRSIEQGRRFPSLDFAQVCDQGPCVLGGWSMR